MREFMRLMASRGLISRPPLLVLAASILALVVIWLLVTTPIIASPNFGRSVGLDYWWSRSAPESYARDLLRTTPIFVVYDAVPTCGYPESRHRAWFVIASGPQADSVFRALFARGGPAARLYALAGLAYLNSPALDAVLAELAKDSAYVRLNDRISHVGAGKNLTWLFVVEERAIHELSGSPPARRVRLVGFVTREAVRRWANILAQMGSRSCAA